MYFQQTSHKWRDIIGVARMSLLYAHARYREQQSIAIHSNPHTHIYLSVHLLIPCGRQSGSHSCSDPNGPMPFNSTTPDVRV